MKLRSAGLAIFAETESHFVSEILHEELSELSPMEPGKELADVRADVL